MLRIVACVKQDIQPIPKTTDRSSDPVRVMKAIEWLNNALPPNTKSTTEWVPQWEMAFTEESSSSQTVEVPLGFFKEYLVVLPDCNAKYIQTKDIKYLQNISRLIVETNPKTGETRGYFMCIAPSLKYLEKTNFKFDKSTYLKRDSQFDGYIIFKDIQGNLVNGWAYSDGKITSSLKPVKSNVPSTKADEWELKCPAGYCVANSIPALGWTQSSLATLIEDVECFQLIPSGGGGDPNGGYNPTKLSVTIIKIGEGYVIGEGEYDFLGAITVTAIPAITMGYEFDKWGGDFSSYGSNPTFNFAIISPLIGIAYFILDDGIDYDDTSMGFIKPAIDKIKQNCGGTAFLSGLKDFGINFRYVSGQADMLFSAINRSVTYYLLGTAYETQVIHELIHAYQYINSSNLTSLNKEIEAFFGMYKYFKKYGITETEINSTWGPAFQPYYDSHTPENYALMTEFVRHYNNDRYINFIDTESCRNTSNVDVFFNCN